MDIADPGLGRFASRPVMKALSDLEGGLNPWRILDGGRIRLNGPIDEAIASYLASLEEQGRE